ncbi:retinoic acid-induced protein 1 isoform X1 [Phycodurus eques]|uniref:retinoic acid-induced protein 1 isoform X1 n=2 Tax=Phycodurus eques TaxID=693459 RepID=UPI002ACDC377|nr:retinoic acid-induced protein 1 isoform X1 [Phycodurus eques]
MKKPLSPSPLSHLTPPSLFCFQAVEAMQSFRERTGGYHSNQPCYQQEPHELSRLETYRHPHHAHPQLPHPGPGPGLSRSAYEARSLVNATSMSTATAAGIGGAPKDIYSQPAYPGFPVNGGGNGNGGLASSQAKKKILKFPTPSSGQHLQGHGGYSNPLGPGTYSAQYMGGGHLQQKWEDPAQLTSYEHEMVGRMEAGGAPAPNSSQYMEQNMLGHSQAQCHQPPTPSYPSPHHQSHPTNPSPSPLVYPQSHLHYPQPSPSPSPYIEKCSPMPPCYKGYSMTPTSQYGRQMSNHSNLKQGGYRPSQNSYTYQHSRAYEPQPSLQAMSNPQEAHPKYQHFSQPQANYCLSELSVRSPEQYYQTCSPSSSHSPARSVGRSPSYSSTPSPLMTNPESFQYGQPPITPGAASSSSSSSAGHQEQGGSNAMLLPPRSHPSPSVPHAASHSFTNTLQGPTVKERFSEKLLSNPSLWSLNVLTSQVENISNNVQQLLLSETLVANKKSTKRNSGGSNSSSGSAASSRKGEEYKSPYPESAGSVGGGPMQELYSNVQHQRMPMELHEGGYSSSSDEQLERGYFYRSQGRSPAQPPSNTHINVDTVSSCSMTSPDDVSTRSGDSGLHNFAPDPIRCQSVQGGDTTPVKSISEGRSPISLTIPSPIKPDTDSSSDIQQIIEPVKEHFEESPWMEKSADKEAETRPKTPGYEGDVIQPKEREEKWSDEDKCSFLYSQVDKGQAEKDFCYAETVFEGVQRKYDPDSLEQSPAACSDSSHNFVQEIKEAYKSESSIASESSLKTFNPVSDFEQDQYSTEKEDSTDNTSPTSQIEKHSKKTESKELIEEDNDEQETDLAERKQYALSLSLSDELRKERGEEENICQSLTSEFMNNRHGSEKPSTDLCNRTENQRPERHSDNELAGVPAHPNVAAAPDSSSRESAIGDTAPQPQSAMPVFSALNDNHIDHSDAKVLEPDSPQLPGKSILPSAPSWADTPPSPKKGDEDMEPGLSCSSAVTPLAKPEPVAPSAQPRAFGRKHARGRRKMMLSSVAIRRQLSLERDEEKDEEGDPLASEKTCRPHSKTMLFSNQTDLAHQESVVSQATKMFTEGLSSRMCTRSFHAADLPSKGEAHLKRKPGPKPGPKPGIKNGSKTGPKPRSKPAPKLAPKPGPKPGLKSGLKAVSNTPDPAENIEALGKQKPGPKPGLKPPSKPGPKPVSKSSPKPGPKPGLKSADALSPTENMTVKASVGRPKGSVSKVKQTQQEEMIPHLTGPQGRGRKNIKTTLSQINQVIKVINHDEKPPNDIKSQQNDSKNMTLRSRKPSETKVSKEKEKNIHKDLLTPALTEIGTTDCCQKEERSTKEQSLTPYIVKDIDTPTERPAMLPAETIEEKSMLPLKCQSSTEPSPVPVKKKRGPKPKPKPLQPQAAPLEQVVSTPKEADVPGPRRKRGPPKKESEVPYQPKHTPSNVTESDQGDVPVVPPHCPTRTKVLPPRKGRGQKYEAMVQKITSPSSKKYLPTPQTDINLNDDATTKDFSPHALKDGETAIPVNGAEMMESEVKSRLEGVNHPEGATRKEVKRESEKQEISQGAPVSEDLKQRLLEEDLNDDAPIQEHKPGTMRNVQRAMEAQVDLGPREEWTQQAKALVAADVSPSKSSKRKRWAMVESTDACVVALEAGSLIVTTPRAAKQRAIKNNHEMHLKQKRKRKGQAAPEETEAAKEIKVEATEQQDGIVEETITPSEVPTVPISTDDIKEGPVVGNIELVQKSRRGRKPSANPVKRKRGKSSSEEISDKQVKVYKKPGPKPGMKDALEVIEAVVRAAGCEAEKVEREKQEAEIDTCEKEDPFVGPVVTISEKQTETISVKRFRNNPLSFCPYVRVNNSRDFSSWCAIVNKPEDVQVFQRRRKKGILRMKNPFTVAKIVPHTAAMLQGPTVNTALTGRRLMCCLCGKPPNYRDLGDLCGPYYTEDGVPRKLLTIEPTLSPGAVPEKNNKDKGNEEPCTSKSKAEDEAGGEKADNTQESPQAGSSSRHHHWPYRRAERKERTPRKGVPRRIPLRERLKSMKQLQAGLSNNQDGLFQRRQEEAEANEHWAHENCAIWTKGVIMVAGRLYGLKEAADNSVQTSCHECQIAGASLSCCWRSCSRKYHFVCAKEIGCTFHEDDFSIKCPKHEDL